MGTVLKQMLQNVAQKEVIFNSVVQALSPSGRFGRKYPESTGLTLYLYGGRYANTSGTAIDIADTSITCTASVTNYIQYNIATNTVTKNSSGYTAGLVAIGRAVCNATTITSWTDDRIDPLLPNGTTSKLESGAVVQPGLFDLLVTNPLVGASSTTLFSVKGGKYWSLGKAMSNSSETSIPDYLSSSQYTYLTASSVYYVWFDFYTKTIKTNISSSLTVQTNGKLLYRITTDATQISEVLDYRGQNLFIKSRTWLNMTPLYAGPRVDFNSSSSIANYENQTADGSIVSAVSGIYPKLCVPYTCLVCITAEKGYSAGDEAEYITGASLTAGMGKPLKIASNGTVSVFLGAVTQIWNSTTNAWETPTVANWALVLKMIPDLRS